eukprot:TRINITY_DN5284_c0_g1_i1.p1 TRINITY_DN5284_c0_g1~~TRINITY_DN5284_c0_g1_i1.p1  ORF type:complete len:128 (+),score=33.58 TRINITY_DN5284_c0_g1_i1:17-400(+)
MEGVSLAKLYKIHEEKKERRSEETEKLQKSVVTQVGNVTAQMVDSVNLGVATVFRNQQKLEMEARQLDKQANKLSKQSADWIKLLDDFNVALKELGDVENWSQKIENNMRDIVQVLEFLHSSSVPQQ